MFTELWPRGPRYKNDGRAFPLTADSVLLADFAGSRDCARVLDIGCGSGIIGLLIAYGNTAAHVTGVEISTEAAALARENISENALEGRFDIITGDITNTPLQEHAFDLIVCNPPYFEKGRGKPAGIFREESTARLGDIIKTASRLLSEGGAFCMVLRPERLEEARRLATESGFALARLRFVRHNSISNPSMALIEARFGENGDPPRLPDLLLKNENGGDSEEVRRIYRMEQAW